MTGDNQNEVPDHELIAIELKRENERLRVEFEHMKSRAEEYRREREEERDRVEHVTRQRDEARADLKEVEAYRGEWVGRLVSERDALRAALRKAVEWMNPGGRNKQGPGHSHEVPGVWDSDNIRNGRAGKPCKWCTEDWPSILAALGNGGGK